MIYLDSAAPDAARTKTAVYGTPRRPFVAPLPDLDVAPLPDLDILALAANALRLDSDLHALCDSSAHVRAICRQVDRLDTEAIGLKDALIGHRRELAALHEQLADQAARLSTREARIAGLEAELRGARDTARAAMALRDTAQAEVLRLFQVNAELAHGSVAQSERRSPTIRVSCVPPAQPAFDVSTTVVDMPWGDP